MHTDIPVSDMQNYQLILQKIQQNRETIQLAQEKQLYEGLSEQEIDFYKRVTEYTEKCSYPAVQCGGKPITEQISPVYFPYIYQGLPALSARYAGSFAFIQQAIQQNQDYILDYAKRHNMDLGVQEMAADSGLIINQSAESNLSLSSCTIA